SCGSTIFEISTPSADGSGRPLSSIRAPAAFPMLMANGRSVTHIRTAPAPSFSSYVCPLSMRMRTHVFFATLTTSLYGDLISAVAFCTADIHARVDIEPAFVGAGAVRGLVGVAFGVATAEATTGDCV